MPEDKSSEIRVLFHNFERKIKQLRKDRTVKEIELAYIKKLHDQQVNSINGDIDNIDFNIKRQDDFFREKCKELKLIEEVIESYLNFVLKQGEKLRK